MTFLISILMVLGGFALAYGIAWFGTDGFTFPEGED